MVKCSWLIIIIIIIEVKKGDGEIEKGKEGR